MESSKSRIVYVEPNFVNGLSSNGVDFSVPLDDLCISVDLIAEVVNRNAVVSDSETIINNLNVSKISFFEGIKLDNEKDNTFLTTYFTDITYEDANEKGIIEGLGISSINISFDSWYMPIVSINFVDVRGSSIFVPNEYDNENKNKSYITSEKIFKCFFTFPYPKFKLIVKGFYGSPVTFNLSCSKFNGTFNSTNGNFEATATFVGYNYSLLTDINFQYLIAAPQDEYYGKSYFDSKKNSEEWKLSGGEEMPRLNDLLPLFKKSNGIIDEILNTDKTSIKNKEISKEKEILENIKGSYNDLINKFEEFSNIIKICENSEEIVYGINYGDNDKMEYSMSYTNSFIKSQNNFINSVKKYNTDPLFKSKSFKKLPNDYSIDKKLSFGEKFSFSKAFIIKYSNGKISSITPVEADGKTNIGKSIDNFLKNRKYNNNRSLSSKSIEKIKELISTKNSRIRTHLYIFKKYNFLNEIDKRINECDKFIRSNQKNIGKLIDKTIKLTIGFSPTVGNISKIIFAHLDTFLNSIYRCMDNISSEIKNGERNFSDFGISISQTDLSYNSENGNSVLAFPMIVNSTNNDLSVNQWIGDFNPNSQECQLINGYIKSSIQVKKENELLSSEINNEGVIEDFCQINPCDFSYSKNPFRYSNIENSYLIDLIGHIGVRGTYLFGIMSNTSSSGIDSKKMINIATISGELDACNYYLRNIDKEIIESEIINKIGTGDTAVEKIISILCCSTDDFADYNDYTKKYRFEYELINGSESFKKNRNPIFIDEGNNLKYSYIFTKDYYNDNLMLVPVYPYSFNDYIRVFAYNGTPFKFPDLSSDNINEICATINDNIINIDEEKYKNISIFNIFSESESQKIYEKYQIYKNGSLTIKDYSETITEEKINDMFEYIWHLTKKDIQTYYDTNPRTKNLFKGKMGDTDLRYILPSSLDEAASVSSTSIWGRSSKNFMLEYNKTNVSDIALGTFKEEDENYSKYYIPYLNIYKDNIEYSLFGSFFYYMQNRRFDGESDDEYFDRSLKSKSILFLSSLPFNKSFQLSNNSKIGGIYFVPKIFLLYIGGLLWRERYFHKNGRDCIIYEDDLVKIKEPYINANGYKNECYKYTLIDISSNQIVSINNFGKKADDIIFNLRKEIKNYLISYFEEWSEDNSDGFRYIMNNCELFGNNNEIYQRSDVENLATEWIVNYRNGKYKELLENTNENVVNNKKRYLSRFGSSFLNTYCSFHAIGSMGSFELMFRDNSEFSIYLNKLFCTINIMSFGCYNITKGGESDILINKSVLKYYISNFLKTLKKIVDNKNEEDNKKYNDLSFNKDVKIAMYNYFKSIHDKWLIGSNKSNYSLEKFFSENFIFIDTFYRNIKDKLIINCDYFVNRILDSSEEYSLFSMLSDLYSHHGMIFTPMSHYNNWAEEDTLTNMFKPYAFNSVQTIDEDNKFICMYVHEPSKNLNIGGNGSSYGFKEDSFMISDISLQPSVFLKSNTDINGDVYGYPIPSFGVSFGKSNQSYFKNINVSMDNPVTTEYSAKAIGEIANLGKTSNTKIQFIGQDIYSVYANYSYECKVEMMGCAQIQPLMYFQLTNIPMFRGTYIITNVTHEITPGNMKTTFRGFRMSKYGQPFNTVPFANLNILYKNMTNTLYPQNDYNINDAEEYVNPLLIDEVYNNPEDINLENYIESDCQCDKENGWNGLNEKMKRLFYAIKDSVYKYQNGVDDSNKWTICVKSGMDNRPNSNSDHVNGWAMDLQIVKNGSVIGKMQNKGELGIVFEIICKYYMSYIKQLILEFYDTDTMSYESELIKTLHVSSSDVVNKHEIFQTYVSNGKDINARELVKNISWKNNSKNDYVSNKVSRYSFSLQEDVISKSINNSYLILDKTKDYLNKLTCKQSLNFISKYYKNAASEYIRSYYPNNLKEFKSIFTTFRNTDNTTLAYYFDLNSGKMLCDSYLNFNKSREGFRNQKRCNNIEKFKEKINKISTKYGFNSNWLMGVMVSESGIDPSSVNKSSEACGLIQFTKDYYINQYDFSLNEFCNLSAEEQLEYVDRYFSYWVNNVYKKNNKDWIGFNYPVDVYLTVFSPSTLNTNIKLTSDTIVYSLDENKSAYEANSSLDTSNKGYITIHDLEVFLINRITSMAKDDDYEILNEISKILY